MSSTIRRREFLQMAAGAAAVAAAPTILTARKTDSPVILGSGEHRYEVLHDWPQLPDRFTWQTTHNVAIDKAGNLYVIHEGDPKKPDHPAIFVFDPEGKYVRSFGQQFQGGGHGLEVHEEDGEEFLYVTAYKLIKNFAKLTLKGESVWERRAPMESGMYAKGEDGSDKAKPDGTWGRDRFMPTNIAFHPDERRFLRGRRLWRVCDPSLRSRRQLQINVRQTGQGERPIRLAARRVDRPPHGPRAVGLSSPIAQNSRLQWFTLDGKHLETLDGFLLPANVDTYGDVMLVPDLQARVTLLDGQNKVIAHLGEDAAWRENVMKFKARSQPEKCPAGKFIHPHDACFDADGNIYRRRMGGNRPDHEAAAGELKPACGAQLANDSVSRWIHKLEGQWNRADAKSPRNEKSIDVIFRGDTLWALVVPWYFCRKYVPQVVA